MGSQAEQRAKVTTRSTVCTSFDVLAFEIKTLQTATRRAVRKIRRSRRMSPADPNDFFEQWPRAAASYVRNFGGAARRLSRVETEVAILQQLKPGAILDLIDLFKRSDRIREEKERLGQAMAEDRFHLLDRRSQELGMFLMAYFFAPRAFDRCWDAMTTLLTELLGSTIKLEGKNV